MNTIIYVTAGVLTLIALALLFTRIDSLRTRKQKRLLDKMRKPLPTLHNTGMK